jgi:hypothetical protein
MFLATGTPLAAIIGAGVSRDSTAREPVFNPKAFNPEAFNPKRGH